jgi:hypothetical protein
MDLSDDDVLSEDGARSFHTPARGAGATKMQKMAHNPAHSAAAAATPARPGVCEFTRFTGTKIYLLTSTTAQILTPEELQLPLQQGQVCVSTQLTCFFQYKSAHTDA